LATSAQIEAVQQIQGTYSLITGSAAFTDVSNYASLGLGTPATIKVLLYIQDSTGALFYKNAGYDTANFASPDLEPLLGTDTYSFTLPTDITGAYLTGQYTISMKTQVIDPSGTVNAYKVLYQNITATCNGIIVIGEGSVAYNVAQVSITDQTNYKTYTALTNTIILYPPPSTGQASQTLVASGSPATLVYAPPMGTFPYTGIWQWDITSDITYTDTVTGASTTCRVTKQGSFSVEQSQLCKVLCLLEKYRNEFLLQKTAKNVPEMTERYLLAMAEYLFAVESETCGKPQSTIDAHIAKIYALTGIDPTCDCGCGDGTSQPLVPTTSINGTNGTNGTSFLQGAGAPANNLGSVGDSYLNISNGDVYLKTGASTWTYMGSLLGATGATGATGAAGANGADGVAVLYNNYANASTAGTVGFETLDSYSIPANTLSADGDEVKIHTVFTTNATSPSASQLVRLTFNGASLISTLNTGFFASNIVNIEINARISRVSNTSAKYEVEVLFNAQTLAGQQTDRRFIQGVTTIGTLNFTTTAYTVAAQGDSVVAGDITSAALEIVYYKIS